MMVAHRYEPRTAKDHGDCSASRIQEGPRVFLSCLWEESVLLPHQTSVSREYKHEHGALELACPGLCFSPKKPNCTPISGRPVVDGYSGSLETPRPKLVLSSHLGILSLLPTNPAASPSSPQLILTITVSPPRLAWPCHC